MSSQQTSEEHTPGPWRSGIPGSFTVYGPDGRGSLSGPVADALPTKTGNMRRANANLISAAPELLEALDLVLDDLSCGTMEFPDRWICKAAWDEAMAAINKAKGVT